MVVRPEFISSEGDVISDDLFGGNLLANRGTLYGEGQYDTAINDLGITSLRYPGGSRTEKSFDINNPDAETALDKQTGRIDDWIALSDFFAYAVENGHPVSVVIPTRFNLSDELDESGNRLPDFSEQDLRTFVRDVASGKYGSPEIQAFEIGNEYWHSGQMNSIEYGRLAAEMVDIIDDELIMVAKGFPDAENIDITVQMGYNYGDAKIASDFEGLSPELILEEVNRDYNLSLGSDALYSGGGINWGYIHNKIIINEFEKEELMDSVDGVIAHVYSLGELNEWSRVFELKLLEDTWIEEYPDLEIHVTEWNLKGVTDRLDRHEDYGLHQAEEMLNMLEEFARVGVDHANVWPLLQFTDNALNFGFVYEETNAPGAMFSMLAENLPGKILLDFAPDSERVTEAEFEDITVHGFAGENEFLFYVTPTGSNGVTNSYLDLSGLLNSFESMELTILGVEEGGKGLGSNATSAVLEALDPSEVFRDGILDINLDPEEILQIVVKGVTLSDGLSWDGPRLLLTPGATSVVVGDDFLYGGNGQDILFGGSDGSGPGDGSSPKGTIDGTSSDDIINPAYVDPDGDSVTDDSAIHDVVYGLGGNDTITLNAGNDEAHGGDGDDSIFGSNGTNVIFGGAGNDTLNTGRQGSTLDGGAGNDILNAVIRNGGDHTLTGGDGADTFQFIENRSNKSSDSVITDFEIGIDKLIIDGFDISTLDPNTLPENVTATDVGSDILLEFDAGDSILLENLSLSDFAVNNNGTTPAPVDGTSSDDVVTLAYGADNIEGEGGNDFLYGGNGQDILFGGSDGSGLGDGSSPNGTVDGTSSDDVINPAYVDPDGDSVTDDSAIHDVVYGLGGNDTITLNAGNDEAHGGDGDDSIFGSNGTNVIFGGAGNDTLNTGRQGSTLDGGAGNDILNAVIRNGGDHTLTGGDGADTFQFIENRSNKSSDSVITDFEIGIDKLIIDGFDISTLDPNTLPTGFSTSANGDWGMMISFDGTDTVTLSGVSETEFWTV